MRGRDRICTLLLSISGRWGFSGQGVSDVCLVIDRRDFFLRDHVLQFTCTIAGRLISGGVWVGEMNCGG